MLTSTYIPAKPTLANSISEEEFRNLYQKVAAPLLSDMIGGNSAFADMIYKCFLAIVRSEQAGNIVPARRENDHLWARNIDAHQFSVNRWVYGNQKEPQKAPRSYAGKYGNNSVTGFSGDGFIFRGVGFAQITFKSAYIGVLRRLKRQSETLAAPVTLPYKLTLQYAMSVMADDSWSEESIRVLWSNPAFDMAMMASYFLWKYEAKQNLKLRSARSFTGSQTSEWLSTCQKSTTMTRDMVSVVFNVWDYPDTDVQIGNAKVPSDDTLSNAAIHKPHEPAKPAVKGRSSSRKDAWAVLLNKNKK